MKIYARRFYAIDEGEYTVIVYDPNTGKGFVCDKGPVFRGYRFRMMDPQLSEDRRTAITMGTGCLAIPDVEFYMVYDTLDASRDRTIITPSNLKEADIPSLVSIVNRILNPK